MLGARETAGRLELRPPSHRTPGSGHIPEGPAEPPWPWGRGKGRQGWAPSCCRPPPPPWLHSKGALVCPREWCTRSQNLRTPLVGPEKVGQSSSHASGSCCQWLWQGGMKGQAFGNSYKGRPCGQAGLGRRGWAGGAGSSGQGGGKSRFGREGGRRARSG